MRTNYTYLIITLWALCMGYACIDDKGNYNYLEPNEVQPWEVEEISNRRVLLGSALSVEPTVTGLDDQSFYDFTWSVYTSTGKKADTIAYTQNLTDFMVYYEPGIYTLEYSIKDKRTNLTSYNKCTMTVTTEFAKGLFFLKDINEETDVDFIPIRSATEEDEEIEEIEMVTDLLLNINGKRLKGKAVKGTPQESRYSHTYTDENGEIQASMTLTAYHLLSEKDLGSYSTSSFLVYKDADEFFYSKPENIRPQNTEYFNNTTGWYLINDGKIHGNYIGAVDYIGKMSYARLYKGSLDYNLSDLLLTASGAALVYDYTSKSFLSASYYGTAVTDLNANFGLTNMEETYIAYIPRNEKQFSGSGASKCFVLMQNDNSREYSFYELQFSAPTSNMLREIHPVDASNKVITSPHRAGHVLNYSIFFSHPEKTNELWMHPVTNTQERLVITFPGNEEITHVEHLYHGSSSSRLIKKLAVATSIGDNYKIYLYDFIGDTSEIDQDSVTIYSGVGTVRDVFYGNL